MSDIPWDQPPNEAPCTSWETCGRLWEITEFGGGLAVAVFDVGVQR